MLKIAIVGNIASGKSTVEKIIKNNGFKVFDTDKMAHKILESSKKIKEIFNTTDRKQIAQIVFSDPEKLKLLESIIHPEVKKELLKIFAGDDKIVFVSVPQLFEAGFEEMFDKTIYITADELIRLKRLMKRNGCSQEEAQKRIDAQKEDGKREKCDFIIDNNSDLDTLKKSVLDILQTIC